MVHFFVKRGRTVQDWKIGMEILNGWPIFFSNTAIVKKIDNISSVFFSVKVHKYCGLLVSIGSYGHHNCKLCDKKVIHRRDMISRHLQTSHDKMEMKCKQVHPGGSSTEEGARHQRHRNSETGRHESGSQEWLQEVAEADADQLSDVQARREVKAAILLPDLVRCSPQKMPKNHYLGSLRGEVWWLLETRGEKVPSLSALRWKTDFANLWQADAQH